MSHCLQKSQSVHCKILAWCYTHGDACITKKHLQSEHNEIETDEHNSNTQTLQYVLSSLSIGAFCLSAQ